MSASLGSSAVETGPYNSVVGSFRLILFLKSLRQQTLPRQEVIASLNLVRRLEHLGLKAALPQPCRSFRSLLTLQIIFQP